MPLILDDESVQTFVAVGQISPLLGLTWPGLAWLGLARGQTHPCSVLAGLQVDRPPRTLPPVRAAGITMQQAKSHSVLSFFQFPVGLLWIRRGKRLLGQLIGGVWGW